MAVLDPVDLPGPDLLHHSGALDHQVLDVLAVVPAVDLGDADLEGPVLPWETVVSVGGLVLQQDIGAEVVPEHCSLIPAVHPVPNLRHPPENRVHGSGTCPVESGDGCLGDV